MDYFIDFAKPSNKYLQLFESDPNIKYIEIGTFRKCYWDTPYNTDKFELKVGKIRCKPETTEVRANDLPLLHYYSRDMVEHVVTDTSEMFMYCSKLQSLDVSNWNTSNVTDMSHMFFNCEQLQSLDASNWNTSNVTDIGYMFYYCDNLQSLDVSKWNTHNVTNMEHMFNSCKQLKALDLSNWNVQSTAIVTNMLNNCPAPRPQWCH